MRRCWRCRHWKRLIDFYKGQSKCIVCDKKYYRENREKILAEKRVWYLKNIDKRAIYGRAYRARKKAEKLEPRWRALP